MIPQSRYIAILAGLVALGAHAVALGGVDADTPVEIEGGGEVQVASLGASFRDMTTGTIAPTQAVEADAPAPTEAIKPTTNNAEPVPLEPGEPQPTVQSVQPPKPVDPISEHLAPLSSEVQAVVPVRASKADPTPKVPTESELVPAKAPSKPIEQTQIARPAENASEVDTRLAAVRPLSRPERPEPAREKPVPRPEQTTKKKLSVAAKAGDAKQNAKKGSETGRKPKGAASSQRASTRSNAKGNAEASNYKGLVKREIHRARRKSVNIRGAARVTFRIADNGTLSEVYISRSSGSNRLDKVALAQVRAAAPFPKPPAGVGRQFSIEIKAK